MKRKIRLFKNIDDIIINKDNNNILLITGLSGSGKSYLAKNIASSNNINIFQVEWLIHYKHCAPYFKNFLDEFIDKYNIRDFVNNKWNNCKKEDDNIELKKYINLLLDEFITTFKGKRVIVEGLQLFTLIDYELIKDYSFIIKGTSSINSLKNRIKRDYQKRKDYSLFNKIKWFLKVLNQSGLYQFSHRKKLNKFIENISIR